jgi:hypothetical protein
MAESDNRARRERGETRISTALKSSLGLAVGLVLVAFYVLLNNPAARPGAPSLAGTPTPEVAPDEALKQLRATEDAILTTYGWVDRQNGIAHIPIDRAMELLLQRGLPARPQNRPPSEAF